MFLIFRSSFNVHDEHDEEKFEQQETRNNKKYAQQNPKQKKTRGKSQEKGAQIRIEQQMPKN